MIQVWLGLEEKYDPNNVVHFSTTEMQHFVREQLDKRWDLISDDVHAASFSIDPRFRGISLGTSLANAGELHLKAVCFFMNYQLLTTKGCRR